MNYVSVNGKIQDAGEQALLVSNRGFRYGDGLFETMKLVDGGILLADLHFERLCSGLSRLKFEIPGLFTVDKFREEILRLCQKNHCLKLARVRLSVYRGNGGLYDEDRTPGYTIESWPLDPSLNELNHNGLVIGICPGLAKSCDILANLKSASAQIYSMAALFAKEQKWNDALVLNTRGTIADATIANLFIIKEGMIQTPGLDQGCVAGVMRKYLLDKLRMANYSINENPIHPSDLAAADEIFLTNAIRGIRWVKQYEDKIYTNTMTREIYTRFGQTN